MKKLAFLIFFFSLHTMAASDVLNPIFENATESEFKEALVERMHDLESGSEWLQQSNSDFICLGETHSEKFRRHYVENFFSSFPVDTLFLETTPKGLEEILGELSRGEESVDLLGADIAQVIRTVRSLNPKVKIVGLEETKKQKAARRTKENYSREGFIAQNAFDHYEPGLKHVMLYGSNHCALSDIGLGNYTPAFVHIKKFAPGATSVKTVFGMSEQFLWAQLSLLGLASEPFFLRDMNLIPKARYNHIWKLQRVFRNFDHLYYFP